MVRQLRETMVPPTQPPEFEHVPPRLLIILFTSRVGSAFASRLLAATPYFNNVGEAFNPWRLRRIRERDQLADDAEAARALISSEGTEHAFGAKCGGTGLVGALYTGFLPAMLERITFVTLKRRDAVAQAISIVKARLSGRFHSDQAGAVEVGVEDYERGALEEKIALISRLNGNLDRLALKLGKTNPSYFYEDVCGNPTGFVNSICGLLALPPVDRVSTAVGREILRDDISRQWRDRYDMGL